MICPTCIGSILLSTGALCPTCHGSGSTRAARTRTDSVRHLVHHAEREWAAAAGDIATDEEGVECMARAGLFYAAAAGLCEGRQRAALAALSYRALDAAGCREDARRILHALGYASEAAIPQPMAMAWVQ